MTGKADGGLARAVLGWQPHRPDLTADVRADVTLFDRQILVQQTIRLRSPDGLPRPLRFRGPPTAAGVRVQPSQTPLESLGPGEWRLTVPPDTKEITLKIDFGIPLPTQPADDRGPRQMPVGLLWPATAVRADTIVRVWSNTVSGRTLTNLSTGWRELPIEPVADRDALPALALVASGGEAPLVLESREADEASAVAVWVDRGLIQAWAVEDGATGTGRGSCCAVAHAGNRGAAPRTARGSDAGVPSRRAEGRSVSSSRRRHRRADVPHSPPGTAARANSGY